MENIPKRQFLKENIKLEIDSVTDKILWNQSGSQKPQSIHFI